MVGGRASSGGRSVYGGTESSNPFPSSGESANFRFRETDDVKSIEIVNIEPGSWLVTRRPIWGVKSEKSKSNGKRQLVILNETLEKALATSGGALPAGIDLVLSGHIHLWEAIGFSILYTARWARDRAPGPDR
jgi:hypothetical protein